MAGVTQRSGRATPLGDHDIYTILLIIATAFVVIATVCLLYQFGACYGLDSFLRGVPVLGE